MKKPFKERIKESLSSFIILAPIDCMILLFLFIALQTNYIIPFSVDIYMFFFLSFVGIEIILGIIGVIIVLIRRYKAIKNDNTDLINDELDYKNMSGKTSIIGIPMIRYNTLYISKKVGKIKKSLGMKDTFVWFHILSRLIMYTLLITILVTMSIKHTDILNKNEEKFIEPYLDTIKIYGYKDMSYRGYHGGKSSRRDIRFSNGTTDINIDYILSKEGVIFDKFTITSNLNYSTSLDNIINEYQNITSENIERYINDINDKIILYKNTKQEQKYKIVDEDCGCNITFNITDSNTNDYKLVYVTDYYTKKIRY